MSSLQSCSVIVFLSVEGSGAFPRMSRNSAWAIAKPKRAIDMAANSGRAFRLSAPPAPGRPSAVPLYACRTEQATCYRADSELYAAAAVRHRLLANPAAAYRRIELRRADGGCEGSKQTYWFGALAPCSVPPMIPPFFQCFTP